MSQRHIWKTTVFGGYNLLFKRIGHNSIVIIENGYTLTLTSTLKYRTKKIMFLNEKNGAGTIFSKLPEFAEIH